MESKKRITRSYGTLARQWLGEAQTLADLARNLGRAERAERAERVERDDPTVVNANQRTRAADIRGG